MTRTTKILLIVSLALFVAGLLLVSGIIDAKNAPALYITLPTGAILFGLFLVFRILEKEMAMYESEQKVLIQAAARDSGRRHMPWTPLDGAPNVPNVGQAANKSA